MNKNITISCPVCGRGKLIVRNSKQTKSRIQLYPPEHSQEVEYYLKCHNCNNQIGVEISAGETA